NSGIRVIIGKNGAPYSDGSTYLSNSAWNASTITTIAEANGTTDYFEVGVYNGGSTNTSGYGAEEVYFTGALVGGGGGSGNAALSDITAATATNTIDNANYAQVWNWNSLTTQNA